MTSPLLLFFLYNYNEPNIYKCSRVQQYKSAIDNLVKKTPDTTCRQTIIEVQLRISEKGQAILYTKNYFY